MKLIRILNIVAYLAMTAVGLVAFQNCAPANYEKPVLHEEIKP